MKPIRLILLAFYLFAVLPVIAQNISGTFINPYKKAIGVKMFPGAITYKQFLSPNKAVEALGYFSIDGFRATILREKYASFDGNESFSWYIGYGGHMGIWSEEWKKNNPTHSAGIAVGIDGIIGLDYKIKGAPLNLSVDWQPSFNFVGSNYFESGWGGIGVRYTL